MNAENRAARRAQSRTRGRKAAGLSILALTGLVSAYAQVLRSPSAYATTTCTVTTGLDSGTGTSVAGELRYCINQINSDAAGGSIAFGSAVSIVQLEAQLPNLQRSLLIDGGDRVTVKGRGGRGGVSPKFGMLKTTSFTGTLSVKNMTMSNFSNYSDEGGVLYVRNGVSLNIEGVTMSDNYSRNAGGAIYNDSAGATTITNSNFERNYGYAGGGALFFNRDSIVTISDSTFTDNQVEYKAGGGDGGAITFNSSGIDATIEASTFDGNKSAGAGGAIYEYEVDSITIVDSTFTNNRTLEGYGAAVALESWSSASISGSSFSGNSAGVGGGGIIYFGSDPNTVSLTSSSVTGNTVDGKGTLYSRANDLVVTNVFIGGNTATAGHAAIYSKRNIKVNFSTIADNTGPAGSADLAVNKGDVTTFTLNGTVIQSGSSGEACEFPGTGTVTVVDSSSVATDASCTFTDPASVPSATSGSIALGAITTHPVNGVAQSYRLPGSASILRSGAPSTNLGVLNASPDQLGTARSGTFVIGSIQNAPAGPTPPPVPAPVPDSGGSDATPTPTPLASSPAKVDPLEAIVTSQNPLIPAGGLPAGKSLLMSNGQPVPLTITPLENRNGPPLSLVVSAPGLVPPLNMTLAGRGDEADPLGLTSKQALILQSEAVQRSLRAKTVKVQPVAVSTGDGFQASSPVKFYLLPSTYLGSLSTDASGAYKGALKIPAGILPGVYTLQANGLAPDGAVRSLSIGVLVKTTRVAVKTVSEKASVYFDSLSPDLTPAGKAALRALVKKTGKQASTVRCVGYVQPTGGTGNDDSLSRARAGNVAAYLRSLGLKGAYVVAGDGRDKTSGGKARRVDVTITYAKG